MQKLRRLLLASVAVAAALSSVACAGVKRPPATITSIRSAGESARDAQKLRSEFSADRHLVVATTDFDLGIGRIWDLGRELDDTAEGLRRTRALFVATSAIPGVFPPVVIDGHVHGDGGVVSNLLIPLEFDDYRALAERLRALGVTEPVKGRSGRRTIESTRGRDTSQVDGFQQ